jgi:hypothetical protein
MASYPLVPKRILSLSKTFESLSSLDQDLLKTAIVSEVHSAIASHEPVFIENSGILFSSLVEGTSIRRVGNNVQREKITRCKYEFEKCNEVTSFQREQFKTILGYQDIAVRISNGGYLLPHTGLLVDLIRGAFAHITKEVVIRGCSDFFAKKLGTIFAFHNRQGISFSDWYAGADIHLFSAQDTFTSSQLLLEHENPTLEHAWEPFEAFCEPVEVNGPTIIDLRKELSLLGFNSNAIPEGVSTEVQIRTFRSDSDDSCYVVTNGLRNGGNSKSNAKQALGCELVVQLPHDFTYAGTNLSRIFTVAWIFLQGAKSRTLEDGDIISLGTPLFPDSDSDLSALLVTHTKRVPLLQKAHNGQFFYMTLVPVTLLEKEFANVFTPKTLQAALKVRGIDQICKPYRRSILAKSSFESLGHTEEQEVSSDTNEQEERPTV